MDVVISSRNMSLTDGVQSYVEKKIDKLQRYMPDINEVRVELAEVKAVNAEERQIAQMTVRGQRGTILRAEERSSDIMIAIDAAVDKLRRQIERYRGKQQRRHRGQDAKQQYADEYEFEEQDEVFEGDVVRRKVFPIAPMDDEEAIEQLELLGHDFFLYYNADTAIVNVVYRRRDGGYGILEPELN